MRAGLMLILMLIKLSDVHTFELQIPHDVMYRIWEDCQGTTCNPYFEETTTFCNGSKCVCRDGFVRAEYPTKYWDFHCYVETGGQCVHKIFVQPGPWEEFFITTKNASEQAKIYIRHLYNWIMESSSLSKDTENEFCVSGLCRHGFCVEPDSIDWPGWSNSVFNFTGFLIGTILTVFCLCCCCNHKPRRSIPSHARNRFNETQV